MRLGSFRQLLLAAFLLIAALLGGAALRAVYTLEDFMAQSAEGAARAMTLSAAAQSLASGSLTMERAARQSLILNDSVLRTRFTQEAARVRAIVASMAADEGIDAQDARQWNAQLDAIVDELNGPPATALARERGVAAAFRELDAINGDLSAQVQTRIARRNRELRDALEASRSRLMQQVALAIAFAVALAFALGIWLARPMRRMERAIVALGEGRMDHPIDIAGPQDVRDVGQRLEWLRLRLVELEADKSRFLRHVSHELKTPLAALHEGVALLGDGVAGELNPAQREIAGILQQNAHALQRQIEALLGFNAAAFEASRLKRRPVELESLVQALIDAQRLQWQAHALNPRVEGGPLTVQADPDKLGTAIANVLSNAIRFSPHGGTVLVRLSRKDGMACIDVHDQGPGVAPADRARIFEPFYRGERQPAGQLPGTGIGLSIVHEYIAAHGGTVGLLSDGAAGGFRIQLPHDD